MLININKILYKTSFFLGGQLRLNYLEYKVITVISIAQSENPTIIWRLSNLYMVVNIMSSCKLFSNIHM